MNEINLYDSENPTFQVDSEIIKNAYHSLDNYLIEYENGECEDKICAIYFSGHSIYFPNTEECFRGEILKKNKFEWYGKRFNGASKHIFIRDIHKQWYLSGINAKISSPNDLLEFLRRESIGYKVICIGSSAGGYAALLYGSLLNAIRIYAFSPRIEMQSLSWRSNPLIDPLYFRLKNTDRQTVMDIINFIKDSRSMMFVFYPIKSSLDKIQISHLLENKIQNNNNFQIFWFNTSKHGVPFPKVALNKILNITYQPTRTNKVLNPFIYSFNLIGFFATIKGVSKQLLKKYFK